MQLEYERVMYMPNLLLAKITNQEVCHTSSLVSEWYSHYFDIPCPGYVSDKVLKQTKIYNSSYLPNLAYKGYFKGNN